MNNRGTREYIIDGVNGIMCDKNDVRLFGKAISRMYDDRIYRRYCADNSRASVRMFADEASTANMKRIYEERKKFIWALSQTGRSVYAG